MNCGARRPEYHHGQSRMRWKAHVRFGAAGAGKSTTGRWHDVPPSTHHRRGQRYLVVVIDHDTGRLIFTADGRDGATVDRFFRLLGRRRSRRITEVSADGATWITGPFRRHCPQAAA
ncbi:MAG: transposase [Candidatus Dormibacteraceae bacterium]